jgi:hypothetical protein
VLDLLQKEVTDPEHTLLFQGGITMSFQEQSSQWPSINQNSIHIERERVEEYYGIRITFAWKSAPLSQEQASHMDTTAYQEISKALNSRNARWSRGRPLPPLKRSDFAEQGLVLALLDAIRASAEWNAFYADPERSTTFGPLDGAGENYGSIKIPPFNDEDALQSVDLSFEGGEIVFQARDA